MYAQLTATKVTLEILLQDLILMFEELMLTLGHFWMKIH